MNIGLKDKVHTQAKVIAVLKKTPLSKYLEKAIEEAIERDKKLLEEVAK